MRRPTKPRASPQPATPRVSSDPRLSPSPAWRCLNEETSSDEEAEASSSQPPTLAPASTLLPPTAAASLLPSATPANALQPLPPSATAPLVPRPTVDSMRQQNLQQAPEEVPIRECGTPGCTLRDGHPTLADGRLHESESPVLGRRSRSASAPLRQGDEVQATREVCDHKYWHATVVEVRSRAVRLHYFGWRAEKHDQWIGVPVVG